MLKISFQFNKWKPKLLFQYTRIDCVWIEYAMSCWPL